MAAGAASSRLLNLSFVQAARATLWYLGSLDEEPQRSFRMRQASLSLGRIFGIEVRVHATWLLAFVFITWSLTSGYFRFVSPRQGLGTPLLLGAISALLLFASVLVHEFSHSLVARARGLHVRDITLFIFGGVSNIGGEARTARDEFLIAVVGPLTSFVLAGVFWLRRSSSLGARSPERAQAPC